MQGLLHALKGVPACPYVNCCRDHALLLCSDCCFTTMLTMCSPLFASHDELHVVIQWSQCHS